MNILTGNVGDSKCILISEASWEMLTYDHLASDHAEEVRIEKKGGFVIPVGRVSRVQGQIAVTRSIGNKSLKDYLISEPYIHCKRIQSNDIFLVLASDGLFEA